MSLRHKINECIDKKMDAEWKTKTHRELNESAYEFFKIHGEGLYNFCVESKNNNFAAKMIALLSGKYSHGCTMFYHENIKSMLTADEWHRLQLKYYTYYGEVDNIEEKLGKIKVLVLASADSNGMNYFDYSSYQGRKQVIMKPELTDKQMKKILHSYLTSDTMNALYDYTGLAFWWLNRMFDDERAWYCSEIMYDKYKEAGVIIADDPNPSPTQIVKFAEKMNTVLRYD